LIITIQVEEVCPIASAMIKTISSYKNGLKILHLNAQSLLKKIDEFRFLFTQSNVDVICVSDLISRNKLAVAYNNIARFIFSIKPHESISSHVKQIFGLEFSALVEFRTLILLHIKVKTEEPNYWFSFLNFAQSTRTNNIIPRRKHYSSSENHFFAWAVKPWNNLQHSLKNTRSARQFRKEILLK